MKKFFSIKSFCCIGLIFSSSPLLFSMVSCSDEKDCPIIEPTESEKHCSIGKGETGATFTINLSNSIKKESNLKLFFTDLAIDEDGCSLSIDQYSVKGNKIVFSVLFDGYSNLDKTITADFSIQINYQSDEGYNVWTREIKNYSISIYRIDRDYVGVTWIKDSNISWVSVPRITKKLAPFSISFLAKDGYDYDPDSCTVTINGETKLMPTPIFSDGSWVSSIPHTWVTNDISISIKSRLAPPPTIATYIGSADAKQVVIEPTEKMIFGDFKLDKPITASQVEKITIDSCTCKDQKQKEYTMSKPTVTFLSNYQTFNITWTFPSFFETGTALGRICNISFIIKFDNNQIGQFNYSDGFQFSIPEPTKITFNETNAYYSKTGHAIKQWGAHESWDFITDINVSGQSNNFSYEITNWEKISGTSSSSLDISSYDQSFRINGNYIIGTGVCYPIGDWYVDYDSVYTGDFKITYSNTFTGTTFSVVETLTFNYIRIDPSEA